MRVQSFMPVLLALAPLGCWFSGSLPDALALRCQLDADCPADQQCSQLDAVCLPKAGTPPTLAVTVTPAVAKAGAMVELEIRTSGTLLDVPRVVAPWMSGPWQGERVEQNRFVYRYVTTGSEPEATHSIEVEVVGAGVAQARADITFDFQPPAATVLLRRPSPDPGVTSGSWVNFAFSRFSDTDHITEALVEVPGSLAVPVAVFEFDPALREGSLQIPTLASTAESVVIRFTLADDAGNQVQVDARPLPADVQPPTGVLQLPGTTVPPVVYGTLITTDAVAYRLGGDLVPDQIPPGDEDGFLPITGDSIPLVVTPLTGGMAELRTVTVELRDVVGNVSAPIEAQTTVLPGLFSAPLLQLTNGRRAISPASGLSIWVKGYIAVGSRIVSARMVEPSRDLATDVSSFIEVTPATGALSGQLDPSLFEDGDWRLELIAASDDNATLPEESRSLPLRIDRVPPAGVTVVIVEGSVTAATSIHVQIFAESLADLYEVRFTGSDVAVAVGDTMVFPQDGSFAPVGERNYAVVLSGEGERTVHVDVKDEAGNPASGEARILVDPDAVDANPFLVPEASANGVVGPGHTVFVLGQVYPSDATLTSASFVFGTEATCRRPADGVQLSASGMSGTVVIPPVPAGCPDRVRLETIVSHDGNVSSAEDSRSNELVIDAAPPPMPEVFVLNARPDGTVGDEVMLSVRAIASDVDSIYIDGDIILDQVVTGTWTPFAGDTLTTRVQLPPGEGQRMLQVRTRDRAGNESPAASVAVTQANRGETQWLARSEITVTLSTATPDTVGAFDPRGRIEVTGSAQAAVDVRHVILQGSDTAQFIAVNPDGSFPTVSVVTHPGEFATL